MLQSFKQLLCCSLHALSLSSSPTLGRVPMLHAYISDYCYHKYYLFSVVPDGALLSSEIIRNIPKTVLVLGITASVHCTLVNFKGASQRIDQTKQHSRGNWEETNHSGNCESIQTQLSVVSMSKYWTNLNTLRCPRFSSSEERIFSPKKGDNKRSLNSISTKGSVGAKICIEATLDGQSATQAIFSRIVSSAKNHNKARSVILWL